MRDPVYLSFLSKEGLLLFVRISTEVTHVRRHDIQIDYGAADCSNNKTMVLYGTHQMVTTGFRFLVFVTVSWCKLNSFNCFSFLYSILSAQYFVFC